MAGMELRSRSGIRSDFRNRLQVHRSSSRARLDLYSIAMGKRRAPANLLLGAALVSSCARTHLFDRFRIALGPDRRPYREHRSLASQPILTGVLRTIRLEGVLAITHAFLVALEVWL